MPQTDEVFAMIHALDAEGALPQCDHQVFQKELGRVLSHMPHTDHGEQHHLYAHLVEKLVLSDVQVEDHPEEVVPALGDHQVCQHIHMAPLAVPMAAGVLVTVAPVETTADIWAGKYAVARGRLHMALML